LIISLIDETPQQGFNRFNGGESSGITRHLDANWNKKRGSKMSEREGERE
jgi:hypothetical protein